MIINKGKFVTLAALFATPLAIAAPTSHDATNTAPSPHCNETDQPESKPEVEWCQKACFAVCAGTEKRCRTSGKSRDDICKERTDLCEESCVPLCAIWD